MRDITAVTGLAVTREGHILVGLQSGTVAFGLTPEEMRSLAGRLLETADAIEADAAMSAASVLRRVGGLQ